MDKKTLTIILAIALIVAFFLPFASSVSALDIVKSKLFDWKKYLLLVPPVCGVFLVLGELNNNYLIARSALVWLPFLTVLFWIIIGPLINGVKFEYIFKAIGKGYGVGLWTTIVASILLAFYNPAPANRR